VREAAARAYFLACLTLGRILRSARYSTVRVVSRDGAPRVRKTRRAYAPLLVWLGGPLARLLDTGVRVLPRRDWEVRERQAYRTLHGTSVEVDVGGALILPYLAGATLAALLDDPALAEPVRRTAIERAVAALAELHRAGFTHGDAMAENVMVDLDAGVARWFDFETVHEASRPTAWRRADDLRALLATCLLRTAPARRAETLRLVLDAYADEEVARAVAASFTPVPRRPLAFHLAQAGLSLREYREIARLLQARFGE
jgi:hypothetical protein